MSADRSGTENVRALWPLVFGLLVLSCGVLGVMASPTTYSACPVV
ncbi:hypothetical protein [Hydrogenophaga sp.]|nr:hypothetical protein [Hydrogenophaga sp.]